MDGKPRILVVEDDLKVVEGLINGLRRAGFDITVAMDGDDAANQVVTGTFDLIVLDLMLPGRSGHDVLTAMSGRVSTPVVVISARTELEARLTSFDLGAVDFVPKPFWIEELVARIRSRLDVREASQHRTRRLGGLQLDLDARHVSRDGSDLGLTHHEFNILAWLVQRPNRPVSRRQLAENTLGEDGAQLERTVDSHVSRIRNKLGPDAVHLRTVWGVGYAFDPEARS